jgi:hypothetical protein
VCKRAQKAKFKIKVLNAIKKIVDKRVLGVAVTLITRPATSVYSEQGFGQQTCCGPGLKI